MISGSRRRRIAIGSGTSVQQVNNLMKQFNDMRKMMRTMNKFAGKPGALAKLKNMAGGR